jgi:hypothetical protein
MLLQSTRVGMETSIHVDLHLLKVRWGRQLFGPVLNLVDASRVDASRVLYGRKVGISPLAFRVFTIQ